MGILDEIKGQIGAKINGISLNIDLVNYCCLKCPSCAVGSIGGRATYKMDLEYFQQILDKAQSETKIRHIQLYAYSDPCLHPELHEFVQECTDRGIKTHISTMLQTTKCDFANVIEARPTEFRISMPGWEQMAYYQKGASPKAFDRKFREVTRLPRHKETTWTMAFHLYRDNGHELAYAKKLAEDHGLKFVAIPSIFMPLEKYVEKRYSAQDNELISHLIETPEESTARMKYSQWCPCFKQVTIDAMGRVFLCQLVYEDRFLLGNFLDMDIETILAKIREHDFCGKCIKARGNQYESCFADFVVSNDPIGDANRKRMRK